VPTVSGEGAAEVEEQGEAEGALSEGGAELEGEDRAETEGAEGVAHIVAPALGEKIDAEELGEPLALGEGLAVRVGTALHRGAAATPRNVEPSSAAAVTFTSGAAAHGAREVQRQPRAHGAEHIRRPRLLALLVVGQETRGAVGAHEEHRAAAGHGHRQHRAGHRPVGHGRGEHPRFAVVLRLLAILLPLALLALLQQRLLIQVLLLVVALHELEVARPLVVLLILLLVRGVRVLRLGGGQGSGELRLWEVVDLTVGALEEG
jgi:hypothetical protein